MNLQITGHQISITPAIKKYILQKFAKIQRHYSQNIHAYVVLEVNKLSKKIEVTTHPPFAKNVKFQRITVNGNQIEE